MSEHKEIYLEPEECADNYEGRMWCEDGQCCDDCEKPWIKYVRADLCNRESLVFKINDLIEDISTSEILNASTLTKTIRDTFQLRLENLIKED